MILVLSKSLFAIWNIIFKTKNQFKKIVNKLTLNVCKAFNFKLDAYLNVYLTKKIEMIMYIL